MLALRLSAAEPPKAWNERKVEEKEKSKRENQRDSQPHPNEPLPLSPT